MFWIPFFSLALAFTSDRQRIRQGPLQPLHPGWMRLQHDIGELVQIHEFPNDLALWLTAIAEAPSAPQIMTQQDLQIRQGQLAHHAPDADMEIDLQNWTWKVQQGRWIIKPGQEPAPASAETLFAQIVLPSATPDKTETIEVWKTL